MFKSSLISSLHRFVTYHGAIKAKMIDCWAWSLAMWLFAVISCSDISYIQKGRKRYKIPILRFVTRASERNAYELICVLLWMLLSTLFIQWNCSALFKICCIRLVVSASSKASLISRKFVLHFSILCRSSHPQRTLLLGWLATSTSRMAFAIVFNQIYVVIYESTWSINLFAIVRLEHAISLYASANSFSSLANNFPRGVRLITKYNYIRFLWIYRSTSTQMFNFQSQLHFSNCIWL